MSSIRTSSGLQPIKALSVRDNGVLVPVQAAYVRTANGLEQWFSSAPAVSVNPSYVNGTGNSSSPITISTAQATVTAPSGSTFAWSSPDSGWSAVSPTSASSSFRKTSVPAGGDYTTTFTCAVTTSSGTTNVSVTAEVVNAY